MDFLRQLNAAVGYIEQNLSGEVDLQEAARIACIAPDSFLRLFSYLTGMSAAVYIRRRRLTLAADQLQRGSERILDIALRYGYGSADAFSRAFSRQHGVAPAAFRKNGGALHIYPPVSFHISIKGAKEMDFRIEQLEETALYGVSKPFDAQQYPNREALRHRMWDEKEWNIPAMICEGGWNHPANRAYDGCWYGLWRDGRYFLGRKEQDAGKKGLEKQALPAGQYAAFRTKPGGLAWEELPKLWSLIVESWLPSSGYRLRSGDLLEVYHLWSDHEARRKNRYYEIFIPVEEDSSRG